MLICWIFCFGFMVGKPGLIIGAVQVYHAQEIRTPADELARQAMFLCPEKDKKAVVSSYWCLKRTDTVAYPKVTTKLESRVSA
jgi:hypothetical protein